MDVRVIAVDGGKSSGITLVKGDWIGDFNSFVSGAEFKSWTRKAHTWADEFEVARFILNLAVAECVKDVVLENFILKPTSNMDHDLLSPVRINANISAVYHQTGLQTQIRLSLQTAESAKAKFGNDVLRELELYVRGKDHVNDSRRHALLWLKKNEPRIRTKVHAHNVKIRREDGRV